MTAAEMLARVGSYELSEWAALYRVEAEERRQAAAEQHAGQDAPEVVFAPGLS